MLKKSFATILLLITAGAAMAEEVQKPSVPLYTDLSVLNEFTIDDNGKNSGPGRIIHSSEIKKGVYVNAEGGWHSNYPQAAQIIKNLLIAKGIKVADKPEDADIGLDVNDMGFDFSEVATGETTLVSGNHIATAAISGLAVLISPSNIFQAVSDISGMSSRGTKQINACFNDDPTLTGRKKLDGKNNSCIWTYFTYKSAKSNAEVTTAVFTAYATRLVDTHFIIDAKVEEPPKVVDSVSRAEPTQPVPYVASTQIAANTETAPASSVPSTK